MPSHEDSGCSGGLWSMQPVWGVKSEKRPEASHCSPRDTRLLLISSKYGSWSRWWINIIYKMITIYLFTPFLNPKDFPLAVKILKHTSWSKFSFVSSSFQSHPPEILWIGRRDIQSFFVYFFSYVALQNQLIIQRTEGFFSSLNS